MRFCDDRRLSLRENLEVVRPSELRVNPIDATALLILSPVVKGFSSGEGLDAGGRASLLTWSVSAIGLNVASGDFTESERCFVDKIDLGNSVFLLSFGDAGFCVGVVVAFGCGEVTFCRGVDGLVRGEDVVGFTDLGIGEIGTETPSGKVRV